MSDTLTERVRNCQHQTRDSEAAWLLGQLLATLERVEKARAWETQEADLWSKRAHAAEAQVEAMRKALERSAEGWANAIELRLIPPRHVLSAEILRDEARASLASSTPESSVGAPAELDPKLWEVEVRLSGERILTIGHSHLSGLSDIDKYGDAVRTCGEHLLSFIGTGEPTPCFACGDSGQERWVTANGEEVGPCSVCCEPDGAPAEARSDNG